MKEWVRKFILKRAGDVFCSKGFTKATIDEIAQAAELSKPTLYNYFPSKRALFIAVLEDLHTRIAEMIQPFSLDGEHPFPERLASMTEEISRYFYHHQGLIRIMLFEQEFSAVAAKHIESKHKKNGFPRGMVFQTVENFFKHALERGEIKPQWDPDLLAMLFVGMTSQVNLNQVINGWDEESYLAKTDQLSTIFCRGILPDDPGNCHDEPAGKGENRRMK